MNNLTKDHLILYSQEWLKEIDEKSKVFTQSSRPELDQMMMISNGLVNYKNNCYVNAIIQCLPSMHTLFRHLFDSFLNFEVIIVKPEFSLLKKFLQVLRDLQDNKAVPIKKINESSSVYNFKAFLDEFFHISNGQFVENSHNDAHEFLMWLIDFLEQNFCNIMDVVYFENENENNKHEGMIKMFFSTKINQQITCINGHESIKCFNELCFSLDIENSQCLNESIKAYFDTEHMNSQHVGLFFCAKCKVKVNATKKLKINKTNEILIFHLKRFKV
jgi:ubiquitin C-terminal hydrolase